MDQFAMNSIELVVKKNVEVLFVLESNLIRGFLSKLCYKKTQRRKLSYSDLIKWFRDCLTAILSVAASFFFL